MNASEIQKRLNTNQDPITRAFARLFLYLDYVQPSAPRNALDPYQVDTQDSSYSFADLRKIFIEFENLKEKYTEALKIIRENKEE